MKIRSGFPGFFRADGAKRSRPVALKQQYGVWQRAEKKLNNANRKVDQALLILHKGNEGSWGERQRGSTKVASERTATAQVQNHIIRLRIEPAYDLCS